VSVATSHSTYAAEYLVLCVGARTLDLVPDLELSLEIERQSVFWMEAPDTDRYNRTVFPIWAYEYKPGHICYGFPDLPRGVKASVMHSGEIVPDPDLVSRIVSDDEFGALKKALAPVLPELAHARDKERDVCLFTNTPDHDFVIDWHPDYRRVLISSACSGHGFKFASVVGEIQSDLVIHGRSRFDLTPFSILRPGIQARTMNTASVATSKPGTSR
jgi:glycine/D-amino acid oxidase-like deaminating enzyme